MKKSNSCLMNPLSAATRLATTPTSDASPGSTFRPGLTKWVSALFVCLLFCSCHSPSSENAGETTGVRTPVTVTSVSVQPLNEYIELNATSTYLQQNFVKSTLNGYIQKLTIKFGDHVERGEILFVIKTKESSAIGNAVNQLDSSFKFSGENVVRADVSGYVMQLNHQQGDYVQDGEQLAVISDAKSFVFVMHVPYEDKPYVSIGKKATVILPDNEVLEGSITSSMPLVDSVSQTQEYSVRVNANHSIPQDLIARVRILKSAINDAEIVPKSLVLTNETQTEYWVMKMIDDSTAVKVTVTTGMEKGDSVQIVSPHFSPGDKILSRGNYGLPDTALVTVSPSSAKGGE